MISELTYDSTRNLMNKIKEKASKAISGNLKKAVPYWVTSCEGIRYRLINNTYGGSREILIISDKDTEMIIGYKNDSKFIDIRKGAIHLDNLVYKRPFTIPSGNLRKVRIEKGTSAIIHLY